MKFTISQFQEKFPHEFNDLLINWRNDIADEILEKAIKKYNEIYSNFGLNTDILKKDFELFPANYLNEFYREVDINLFLNELYAKNNPEIYKSIAEFTVDDCCALEEANVAEQLIVKSNSYGSITVKFNHSGFIDYCDYNDIESHDIGKYLDDNHKEIAKKIDNVFNDIINSLRDELDKNWTELNDTMHERFLKLHENSMFEIKHGIICKVD